MQVIKYLLLVSCFCNQSIAVPCSPSLCSGHGACESRGSNGVIPRQCICVNGWTGADCSLRTCPYHTAWSDVASADETAHNLAECSNQGSCDRITGQCVCESGFEGQACERLSCSSRCNGHGRCESISHFASSKDSGEGVIYTYNELWDSTMIYGCSCDVGYTGYDCSQRSCPTGDDPLTGTSSDPDGMQVNEQQRITCSATSGYFTLAFRGHTTSLLPYNANSLTIKSELENLISINSASGDAVEITFDGVNTAACVAAGHAWTIEFLQDFGDLPYLVPDSQHLVHSTSSSLMLIVQELVKGDKENVLCSGRGICFHETGICECEPEMDSSNGYGAAGRRGDCGHEVTVVTHCPGLTSCNGNGVCSGSPTYTCLCTAGWAGADCSLKSCPTGKPWFSRPVSSNNDAHLGSVECSAAGQCNQETGECICHSSFEGSSCNRLVCPIRDEMPCGGNGQCLTIAQLAGMATTAQGAISPYTYGSVPNDSDHWDWDMVQGCLCDSGFSGYSCELRSCPFGDDPDTENQFNELQTLTCLDADGSGNFKLGFRTGETVLLDPLATAQELQDALEDLIEIDNVSVSCSTAAVCDTSGTTCTIEFLTETGDLPLLEIASSTIDTISVVESIRGTREYDECSHRGVCTYQTGTCVCFPGYGSSDGKGESGPRGDCGYILPYSDGSEFEW